VKKYEQNMKKKKTAVLPRLTTSVYISLFDASVSRMSNTSTSDTAVKSYGF